MTDINSMVVRLDLLGASELPQWGVYTDRDSIAISAPDGQVHTMRILPQLAGEDFFDTELRTLALLVDKMLVEQVQGGEGGGE